MQFHFQKNVGAIVGKTEDGEYYVLDYVFHDVRINHVDDGSLFTGAVGSVFRPVPKDMQDERMEPENAEEYFDDCWRLRVADGIETRGLSEFTADVLDSDGIEAVFDLSFGDMGDKVAELYNSELDDDHGPEDEAEFSECVGGGRCFTRDVQWAKIYDYDALALAMSYERR